MASNQQSLPPGTALQQFEVRGVLGQGGFGITYEGWDTHLYRRVAIKEFLPAEFAIREVSTRTVMPRETRESDYRFGLDRFLDEARTLARFTHTNIVRVLSCPLSDRSEYELVALTR